MEPICAASVPHPGHVTRALLVVALGVGAVAAAALCERAATVREPLALRTLASHELRRSHHCGARPQRRPTPPAIAALQTRDASVLAACWQAASAGRPHVTAVITVGADGAAQVQRFRGRDTGTSLEACLATVINAWMLPPSSGTFALKLHAPWE